MSTDSGEPLNSDSPDNPEIEDNEQIFPSSVEEAGGPLPVQEEVHEKALQAAQPEDEPLVLRDTAEPEA